MAEAQFTVTVEYERESGKFVSRDEIADVIVEALEGADIELSGLGADGDSEYTVGSISAYESTPPNGYDTALKRVRAYLAAFASVNPETDVIHSVRDDQGKTYKLNITDLRKLVGR